MTILPIVLSTNARWLTSGVLQNPREKTQQIDSKQAIGKRGEKIQKGKNWKEIDGTTEQETPADAVLPPPTARAARPRWGEQGA
jgi:hypothetical protein